jgi:aminoglycoside phosphotransferase
MKTHNGNIGKVFCDIGKTTFETLEKFNIPFDEIYFGKPYADVYIDDLALNCYDNIEKALGFYMNTVSPRDFNSISSKSIETYVKKSEKGLDGEIFFYNNIPKQLKDLFPILLDYDQQNNKWYNVEKINGLTVSSLYLSELLTIDVLKHVMNSIKRIHNQEKEGGDYKHINIYDNYSNKLKIRYESYDYSKFLVDDSLFDEIYKGLQNYENDKKGKTSIIHGDTVMTNILINNFGKIKFIDMRGKIGNKLSIYGDAIYDWAKLYQSLIGYDKILQNKNISSAYQNSMTNAFEEYFIKLNPDMNLEDLKLITKSLLFSLIPLHDNLKCVEYLNLLRNV